MNEKLRSARLKRGWSQEEAAEAAKVAARTYQRWEHEEYLPNFASRRLLREAFGATDEELGLDSIVSTHSILSTNLSIVVEDKIKYEADIEMPWQEQRDWPTWFGSKLAQMLYVIQFRIRQSSEGFISEIQIMIDQEIKTMDDALEQLHAEHDQNANMSRRQALITIASMPTMLTWSPGFTDAVTEEFLSQVAASIVACWHLLRGDGLFAVNDILPKFAPTLRTLALRSSRYQVSAAHLATQTAILQAILSMHNLNVTAREAYCRDAIRYSDIARDNRLQAAARMYLGYTLSFCYWPRKPEKAIPVFQQALHVLGSEESLLRSDILMGIAEAYAQCKEEQQALHYIGLAQDHFPAYPEHDQSYIYAECGLTTLYQWEGKMYLELAEHYADRDYGVKASDALMQSIGVSTLSARCTNETVIYQADAARVRAELDIYTTSLRSAAQMALAIKSKKRYSEALIVYQRTPASWVQEPQVKLLAKDIFKQMPGKGNE